MLHIKRFKPNIIHCNDWHTALIPVLLREVYNTPFHCEMKTVFTIHNLKFQGVYSPSILDEVVGLTGHTAPYEQMWFDGAVNFLKGALLYSDYITTVSPTYAQEIQHPYLGENLHSVLSFRAGNMQGILNGLDYKLYDPETDADLFVNYKSGEWQKKQANKTQLQEMLGLPVAPKTPLIGMVTRLTEQKGIDLITRIADELLGVEDAQFVLVGAGASNYEEFFWRLQDRFPEKMAACITFDQALAMKVYAGADLLLMPSRYEPCGVSQMIAMRYGTLPLVRETGGLKDTVIPYDSITKLGNGFNFANYNAHELLYTLKVALELYRREPKVWQHLQDNAAVVNFSWEVAAKHYLELYKKIGKSI
jgi:starch synthase